MGNCCAECGAAIKGVPKFCSECGNSLQKTGNAQGITGNFGNAVNVAGRVSGGIRLISNTESDPYKRPPLDLTPSTRRKSIRNINQAIGATVLINALSVVSGMFTIFGVNIYNLLDFFHMHRLPSDWHINAWLLASITCFLFSILLFTWLIWLKYAKSLSWFGTEWYNSNGSIYSFYYRCVCPYCRGTMDPKMASTKEDKNKFEMKWVCRNNEKHQMDYDPTQIREAAENGKLNFLFKEV